MVQLSQPYMTTQSGSLGEHAECRSTSVAGLSGLKNPGPERDAGRGNR